ncbi:MocR-like pyridoxine biosynthesis transcription factor PdxR [Microbulbifer hainanensis]|uniref:MocR-like pyridoxine biosynthesis transcription factor PdxR n=1 Tax=Microbulbifer hainanensis TaxID=2735675 RepID=UPI0018694D80|nr:PLP-dependent aminotransferase family protein [Microbulbifer hainanensis]
MGYKDIYELFKNRIHEGAFNPGERVPSIRNLAEELGVAKRTVETAYDILIGEGYLISRGPKGTIVNPDLHIDLAPRKEAPTPFEDSDLRKIIDLRDTNGLFRLGVPSLDEFPYKKWLLLCGRVARSMTVADMAHPPVMGYQPLREAIANYLNISRGVTCSLAQIYITSGYKSCLRLILQAISLSKDKVVFEDPGYFFAHKLLKRIVPNLHYVPVDSQGVIVDYLEKHHKDAKFLITTPSHQSPLTVSLSLPRRHKMLEWARKNDVWIIEDDYDGEFHFTKNVIPALKSLDTSDRVIYTGTFSKTIMPSLRTAYIVVPKELVAKFRETTEITETGLALLPQKILASFISEGHFFKHLKRMRSLYKSRRKLVFDAINRIYGDYFDLNLQDGGMHIVALLKRSTQDIKLSDIWQSHNLQVFPLSIWHAQNQKRYGLVIGYTNIKSEEEALSALRLPYKETIQLLSE